MAPRHTTSPRLPHLRNPMTPRPVTAVHLTEEAVRVITDELRTADNNRETGGILLGHHVHDTVTVRHAGTPRPDAVQTPAYFLRDLAHAQTLADHAYAQDHSVWIGEWHTPHQLARPQRPRRSHLPPTPQRPRTRLPQLHRRHPRPASTTLGHWRLDLPRQHDHLGRRTQPAAPAAAPIAAGCQRDSHTAAPHAPHPESAHGTSARAELAERGLVGEREHWQEAIASPPETAAISACEDIDAPAG